MEYENLRKFAHMNVSGKKAKPINILERMPNKKDKMLSILKRERTRKHPKDINNKGFIIGNNYGISALENFNSYNNNEHLPRDGKRGKIFSEFKKLVDNFDIERYNANIKAEKFTQNLEDISKEYGNTRQATCTSLSSLIARIIFLVHKQHCKDQIVLKRKKNEEYMANKKRANIKRTAKYNTIKNQMGVEQFNRMKRHDQHAKDVKNAKKMDDNLDETSKFLVWRKTKGTYLDSKPNATFITPIFQEPGLVGLKELGYADFSTLCDLAKYIIPKCTWTHNVKFSNPQIHFKVDPADPRTQLYQYAAMHTPIHGDFVAQLLRTTDVDKNSIFNITGYHEHSPKSSSTYRYQKFLPHDKEFYININNLTNNVFQSLPKRWSKFALWQGYGIMGNPGHASSVLSLLKICKYNIDSFSFIKDGTRYIARYTLVSSQQMNMQELLNKIPNKLEQAAKLAEEARKQQKKQQAEKAREKYERKKEREKFGIPFFPTTKSTKKSTKLKLTQLLAQGLIDEKTFKMGMSALG